MKRPESSQSHENGARNAKCREHALPAFCVNWVTGSFRANHLSSLSGTLFETVRDSRASELRQTSERRGGLLHPIAGCQRHRSNATVLLSLYCLSAFPGVLRKGTWKMSSQLSRRNFVGIAGATSLGLYGLSNLLGANPTGLRTSLSPDEILQDLLEGNARFASGKPQSPRRTPQDFALLSEMQLPEAVIIACADSRVPP